EAPAGVSGVSVFASPALLRLASDSRLVTLVRQGRGAAFEAVYDRHHRAILAFCRHMLGDPDEAQDAVQHTFLAAYNDLIASDKPIHLRAWLFTIARNRCYSMLRARRDHPTCELSDTPTEGLAAQVQHRQDLRDLVRDMGRLPDDQRGALVLAELYALNHQEIADVLEVPKEKVKALVFQARESLIATRAARETDCMDIRVQLSTERGGALRRGNLRRHLRECAGCREYRKQVERQRRQLALVLPVVGSVALKDAVIGVAVGGGAAGIVGGGLMATGAVKGGIGKLIIGGMLAVMGTAGTIVAAGSDLNFLSGGPQPQIQKYLVGLQSEATSQIVPLGSAAMNGRLIAQASIAARSPAAKGGAKAGHGAGAQAGVGAAAQQIGAIQNAKSRHGSSSSYRSTTRSAPRSAHRS